MELESGREFLATKNRRSRRCQGLEFRVGEWSWRTELAVERRSEAGEPTGAREHVCGPDVILTTSVEGAREMHLRRSRQVPRRAQRGALRSKVARGCARGARVKIMSVGCLQTAGRYPPRRSRAAKRSLEGCEQVGRRPRTPPTSEVGRRPHHRAARLSKRGRA